jgi:cell division inhibitor SepF
MGALRKAGVWLGLVEEVDDRNGAYDEYGDEFGDDEYSPPVRPRSVIRPSGPAQPPLREPTGDRRTDRSDRSDRPDRYDRSGMDDRSDRDGRVEHQIRAARDLPEPRADRDPRPDKATGRGTVRPLARPSSSGGGANYATQDNLALAPQVQLRERAVVADDRSPRYQITTFHPTTYKEARAIGEHFRDGVPVIMNLTAMDEPDAKRLVDFAAGLAFGLRGSIERVTNRVFLLSPANIQVTAEDKAKIAEGGGIFDQG